MVREISHFGCYVRCEDFEHR